MDCNKKFELMLMRRARDYSQMTVLIIFPVTLQTVINLIMLSIGGQEGALFKGGVPLFCPLVRGDPLYPAG